MLLEGTHTHTGCTHSYPSTLSQMQGMSQLRNVLWVDLVSHKQVLMVLMAW